MITRVFHTVRGLRPVQITNRLRRRFLKPPESLLEGPEPRASFSEGGSFLRRAVELSHDDQTFRLLNLERCVPEEDYAAPKEPLLWDYHFHYFDGLLASEPSAAAKFRWIERWLARVSPGARPAWDPYPTSRRILNWVKWASTAGQVPVHFNASLATQVAWLERALEYHLLGNHLLSNAVALVAAGSYFGGRAGDHWLHVGMELLDAELHEQFLDDGAHFELSPTYHALLLGDLTDLAIMLRVSGLSGPDCLVPTIHRGMRWMEAMTRPDGLLPLFNDAAYGLAPATAELLAHLTEAGLRPHTVSPTEPLLHLRESGYFRYRSGRMFMVGDVGELGPTYQPGHGHCDQLSFELSWAGRPLVVDTGVSTYEAGTRRTIERGTAAHNTVQIGGLEQSEIWKSFRVGRRARVESVMVDGDGIGGRIRAFPNRWTRLERQWVFEGERVVIRDQVLTAGRGSAVARLHFHPDVCLERKESEWRVGDLRISFEGASHVEAVGYEYAPGFNRLLPARCLEITFERGLTTVFSP